MKMSPDSAKQELGSPTRFLRTLLGVVLVIVVIVLAVNITAFRFMIQPENIGLAQMVSGWGRTYKPILHDRTEADYLFFGASWVRDLFDPQMLQEDYGIETFNFGVSGGKAYENRRFLQSALAVNNPEAVFLNLDSFDRHPTQRRVSLGFDDRLLNMTEEGDVYPYANAWRAYMIGFGGAAVGHNLEFLSHIMDIKSGKSREETVRSYDQFDFGANADVLNSHYQKIFSSKLSPSDVERFAGSGDDSLLLLDQLENAVGLACSEGVDVKAFTIPQPIFKYGCEADTGLEMLYFDKLQELSATCESDVSMHVYNYPNKVTLEAYYTDEPLSYFYREDGHPRPTLGRLIFANALDLPFVGEHMTKADDFGVEVMSLDRSEAEAVISEKKAGCAGGWAGLQE